MMNRKGARIVENVPQKQREGIWNTANRLYPTFADLMGHVQELVQDDLDSRNGVKPMEIDMAEDEGKWVSTGQTLIGKDDNGDET